MMTSVLRFGVLDVKAHVTPEPAGPFLRGAPGAWMRLSTLPFPLFSLPGGVGDGALVIARAGEGPLGGL